MHPRLLGTLYKDLKLLQIIRHFTLGTKFYRKLDCSMRFRALVVTPLSAYFIPTACVLMYPYDRDK